MASSVTGDTNHAEINNEKRVAGSLHDSRARLLSDAIVNAAKQYMENDAEALRKSENYDGFVKVQLAGDGEGISWISTTQIGNGCKMAEKRLDGKKIRLVCGVSTGNIYVRGVVSGLEHGEAVGYVSGEVYHNLRPYNHSFHISIGLNGLYGTLGTTRVSADPNVTVRSFGLPGGRGRARDHHDGPLFFAEVERGNRTLLGLIRHIGMLFANFPNLNAVLGIKGEKIPGDNTLVLILIERREGIIRVVRLIDFGNDAYSAQKRANMEQEAPYRLPPVDTIPIAGTHGAAVTLPFPQWERYQNGRDPLNQNNPVQVLIPSHYCLVGARDVTGAPLATPTIDGTAPISLNLDMIV